MQSWKRWHACAANDDECSVALSYHRRFVTIGTKMMMRPNKDKVETKRVVVRRGCRQDGHSQSTKRAHNLLLSVKQTVQLGFVWDKV